MLGLLIQSTISTYRYQHAETSEISSKASGWPLHRCFHRFQIWLGSSPNNRRLPSQMKQINKEMKQFLEQDFKRRNILAQAQCVSDDISDVSSKTIIHYRLKIIGIYSPIASAGLALGWKPPF